MLHIMVKKSPYIKLLNDSETLWLDSVNILFISNYRIAVTIYKISH